ncbi:TPA: N-acetyl-gamma-glutamyl-phosphate reductase [bacterium]|nr:N-acetyl-gamma-glutamyl-phosphate reductase [bacterium]
MLRVGIVGASGYTGSELVRLLVTHPKDVELTCITSETYAGQPISKLHPNLRGLIDLEFESLDIKKVADRCDIVFLSLPHKTSMQFAVSFYELGVRIIDFSADYRLKDAKTYEKWYQEHTSPHLLEKAVYGLPEIHKEEIKTAQLVANPGCYPTGAILAILPALKLGFADSKGIVIDSKSGISGAGKSPSETTHFANRYDNFVAYNVGSHRHIPEIEQELGSAIGENITVCFAPHLVPMTRGILTTAYLQMTKTVSTGELMAMYAEFYKDEPFVRMMSEGEMPQTQSVRGSNFCDVAVKVVERNNLIVAMSAIDNLTKGASSQAMQDMNIMAGFDETDGLLIPGLMP